MKHLFIYVSSVKREFAEMGIVSVAMASEADEVTWMLSRVWQHVHYVVQSELTGPVRNREITTRLPLVNKEKSVTPYQYTSLYLIRNLMYSA